MGSSQQIIDHVSRLSDETRQHCYRVAGMMVDYADKYDYNKELFRDIGLAHDIGKYYIIEDILNKPAKLNELERIIIDKHSFYGYKMLKMNGFSDDIAIPVLYHHGESVISETVPKGTKTQRLHGDILQVIDIYDALASKRPYKNPFTVDEIVDTLLTNKDVNKSVVCNCIKLWNSKIVAEC